MQAWEQDYVDYVSGAQARLRGVAHRLCGSPHEADDLVQSAITTLYVHWKRIRGVGNLDAYVRAMVVRAYLSERRRPWHRVERFAEPPEWVGPRRDGPEDRLVLRAALDQLPRRQRTAVVLRFVCDMSVDEVATAMGSSSGTVKSQTSHALAALRRLLDDPVYATDLDGE